MKSAQSLKNFIAKNLDGFSENNVIIGSVDLSRFPQKNLCVIVPETMEVVEQYFIHIVVFVPRRKIYGAC